MPRKGRPSVARQVYRLDVQSSLSQTRRLDRLRFGYVENLTKIRLSAKQHAPRLWNSRPYEGTGQYWWQHEKEVSAYNYLLSTTTGNVATRDQIKEQSWQASSQLPQSRPSFSASLAKDEGAEHLESSAQARPWQLTAASRSLTFGIAEI